MAKSKNKAETFTITHCRKPSGLVIYSDTLDELLNVYPDEQWASHPAILSLFQTKSISNSELKKLSNQIQFPYRAFLLNPQKLKQQLLQIKSYRTKRIGETPLEWRDGEETNVSLRVVDRLIGIQRKYEEIGNNSQNLFLGSLRNLDAKRAADHLVANLDINQEHLTDKIKNKGSALNYLIKCCQEKGIYIVQGTSYHGIFPRCEYLKSRYRASSGFALRSEAAPIIFIPQELNPKEPTSRQIYTLVYLLALIGRDDFNIRLDSNLRYEFDNLNDSHFEDILHRIVAEVLFPKDRVSLKCKGEEVNYEKVLKLSTQFKLSPMATVNCLKNYNLIKFKTWDEIRKNINLNRPDYQNNGGRTPEIQSAVKKFLGEPINDAFIQAYNDKPKRISEAEIEHLIWGRASPDRRNNLTKIWSQS